MQSSEERSSKGSSRPSLLTPAQQAEADRNRILTKLEHGKAQLPAPVRQRSRTIAWGSSGALALALVGGVAFWMTGDEAAAPHPVPALAAAGVAPARAVAPAPVPAATIHDEPLPATATLAPDASAKPAPDDLRNALEEGATDAKPKHAKPESNDLRAALEEDAAPKKAPPAKPAVKTAKVVAKPAAKPAPKPAPRKAPPRAAPDSDLALLSALVAHTQATRASDSMRALKNELKACRRLQGSKARDCREEACLGQDRSVAVCK